MTRTKIRTVSLIAPPGVQLLDIAGPLDVFAEANRQAGRAVYALEVVATARGQVRSSCGLAVSPDRTLGSPSQLAAHTVLIAGAPGINRADPSTSLVRRLSAELDDASRFGSVCSGVFLLAATGKLHGRRVTTHWALADELAQAHPSLEIDIDSIFVRDGPVRTAAGVTAGMDLALRLVHEDHGREIAMRVASRLVVFYERPGGQLQFSRADEAAQSGRRVFRQLHEWVVANPASDHAVPRLAERVRMSPRHFARLFRAETGVTPAAWVESVRVEAARTLLETSELAPKQIAVRCGFGDVDVQRRAFKRHLGVTPTEYGRQFRRR